MHRSLSLFAALGGLSMSSGSAALAGTPAFSDQTAAAQINAVQTPAAGLHSYLAGGTVGDFNGDGWQDIFFAGGGGTPDQLLINDGDGTFTNRAVAWSIALAHRSTGAAAADFDGDGDLDLYVTSLGPSGAAQPGHHKLYRNNGNETFTDVAAAAGVNFSSTLTPDGFGAAWGDYDLDGDLDLAVAGYLTNDGNRLFRNDGDGTFIDVTAGAGLAALTGVDGFAPRLADMDGDRHPELIWIAESGTSRYFTNDGDGTFTNFTAGSGTNQDLTEMGTTVADFDGDLDFDIYVTTVSTNNLYINQGGNVYVNQAASAGVVETGFGWGTVSIDFDHDRWVDLVATSQSLAQYAFRNETGDGGGLSFTSVAGSIGLVSTASGRGLSNLDYDNDGDQDIVIFARSGSLKLFRNDLSGSDINWIRIFLDPGTVPGLPAHGIGSVVRVTVGGEARVGRIDGGNNYLSQSELSAHFGLGAAESIDEIRVSWSNGDVTTLRGVAVNQTLTITAGALPEDIDGDGHVNVSDLVQVILNWGPCPGCPADVDGSGVVDVNDLVAVILAWG
jgi:hypothetical protein